MAFDPNTLSGILGIAQQDPNQAMGGLGAVSGMGQVPGVAPDNGGMAGALGGASGAGAGGMNSAMGLQMMQMLSKMGDDKAKAVAAPSGGTSTNGTQVKLDSSTSLPTQNADPMKYMTMAKMLGGGK